MRTPLLRKVDVYIFVFHIVVPISMLSLYFFFYLLSPGWDELKFLAIRYQKMFPNILPPAYKVLKFLFRYTKSQRAEASYKAFAEGNEIQVRKKRCDHLT